MPAPSTYQATSATIVDSARNVQGYVIGAVIRENVAKADMSWKFITPQAWAGILAQFDSTRGGSFYQDVTLYLQDTDSWETRKMYVSDRTASIFRRNRDGSIRGYVDARLALIEV